MKQLITAICSFFLLFTAFATEKSTPVWANLFPGMKTIAIVAPGLPGKPEQVDLAIRRLREAGYKVKIMPNARLNEKSRKMVPWEKRLADFNQAYFDPEVDALWCVRGGSGAVMVGANLDWQRMRSRKIPVIGFSDITNLHNYMQLRRVGHVFSGPSLTQLTTCDENSVRWFSAVIGKQPLPAIKLKVARGRDCQGLPTGGISNRVRIGLENKYLPDCSGKIVFIESNSRRRTLQDLKLMAKGKYFDRSAAVVFGHLYTKNPEEEEKIVKEFAAEVACPVYYGFTYGHRPSNFLIDFERRVSITADGVMTFAAY